MTPRAAFGVTPQGAMPADWPSQIGGIPGQTSTHDALWLTRCAMALDH